MSCCCCWLSCPESLQIWPCPTHENCLGITYYGCSSFLDAMFFPVVHRTHMVKVSIASEVSWSVRKDETWWVCDPAWGRGTPFPPLLLPCPFTSSSFALYYFSLFPFLVHFTYFLLLSIRSLSTRIVPLHFQAWGHRRRPNLGLVCFLFMIVLSVLLS